MGAAFMTPAMIIPLAIFAGFIVAGFGVPALWTRMNPVNPVSPLSWSLFSSKGIETLTGRLSAGEATVQVLILPVLILGWAITVAVIAALV